MRWNGKRMRNKGDFSKGEVSLPGSPCRPCSHPGCFNKTKEKKPYCLEHLMLNPYPAALEREGRIDVEAFKARMWNKRGKKGRKA